MVQLKTLVLIPVLLIVLLPNVLTKKGGKNTRPNVDPLTKARCDLFCLETSPDQKVQCRNQCRRHHMKPGTCPTSDSPKWADACVEACNSDGQCEGVQRCCRFACGATCAEPTNLLVLPGLPAVPVISDLKEKRRAVLITWNDGVGDMAREVPGKVLYVIEEQHHLGPKYEEARLGEWSFLTRSNKTRLSLRKFLKPGRWYRFRIAAINASGTRGFSAPSSPFTPRKGPKPPAPPKKLKIRTLNTENGIFNVRLEWKEPQSDCPIMKYKVFWSRRLRGLSGELDSVVVNHITVPKNQTYVDINDLQPDSMYFFQVQTISHFGLTKLRSEKVHIFYNTTNGNNRNWDKEVAYAPVVATKRENHEKIKGIKLDEIVWFNHKLKAKISWDPLKPKSKHPMRYYIHWRAINCEKNNSKDLIATTEQTNFEIYELDYDCSYLVQICNSWIPSTNDAQLIVNVPSCEKLQQMQKNSKIEFSCEN